jgi:ATP-dependent DNA helicase PIF1
MEMERSVVEDTFGLDHLPAEILEQIMKPLDVRDFVALSQSSSTLRHVSHNFRFLQNAEMRCQSIIFRALERRESFFITGAGGVGKSHILSNLYDEAKKRRLEIAMTAPTGIAATNLKAGRTIHSYGKLGLAKVSLDDIRATFMGRMGNYYTWRKIWRNTDILVLDEISMVGASLLEKVELCARLSREIDIPFGGMQVVFCGDFYQLPPVQDRFVFLTPLWIQMRLPVIYLTAPVRQRNDLRWFHILNRIRVGELVPKDIDELHKRVTELDPIDILSGEYGCALVSTNKEAKAYNEIAFDANPFEITSTHAARDSIFDRELGPEGIFYRKTRPDVNPLTKVDLIANRLHKIPESVSFKHNAIYIMTFNLETSAGLVNGKVCRFDAYAGEPANTWSGRRGAMRDLKGNKLPNYVLEPIDREIHISGKQFFLRKQVPFCLGHALTIHSAQGMTLSEAVVDCGETIFTSAQTYVAFSRVESLEGLTLLNFDPSRIYANQEAHQFYDSLN